MKCEISFPSVLNFYLKGYSCRSVGKFQGHLKVFIANVFKKLTVFVRFFTVVFFFSGKVYLSVFIHQNVFNGKIYC